MTFTDLFTSRCSTSFCNSICYFNLPSFSQKLNITPRGVNYLNSHPDECLQLPLGPLWLFLLSSQTSFHSFGNSLRNNLDFFCKQTFHSLRPFFEYKVGSSLWGVMYSELVMEVEKKSRGINSPSRAFLLLHPTMKILIILLLINFLLAHGV